MKKLNALSLIILVSFFGTACSHTTQDTSGKVYLNNHPQIQYLSSDVSGSQAKFTQELREVANVEPTLHFPARIGIARIRDGKLSAISGDEMSTWLTMHNELGKQIGEFIPVNPLVADMVSDNKQNAINTIRLGAARQHLDAVLIYEVYSKKDEDANLMAIGDLTIIGAFILPSRQVNIDGFASAILIDVLQGYPYGTAEATTPKETAHGTTFGIGKKEILLTEKIETKTVKALSTEVSKLFSDLLAKQTTKN